jgi:DNA-binding GntR family transcriptional regulator
VREAFQKLELDGLIEIIPNRGAFVLGLTRQDIEDMYELRSAYESIAVKWAIDRMTQEEFDEMQEAFELMEFYTMKQDPAKMLAMNTRFHQIIYNGTKNRMLLKSLRQFPLRCRSLRRRLRKQNLPIPFPLFCRMDGQIQQKAQLPFRLLITAAPAFRRLNTISAATGQM